ncbi:receptor-type tyrosine-protein phosphatase T-like [Diadema antillarum]|uniref:receptor-type tyrosine-protein phosphatase T-like n=1 Tax=Diadema antillarum TaxID=105358 RepID=UPI003A849A2E
MISSPQVSNDAIYANWNVASDSRHGAIPVYSLPNYVADKKANSTTGFKDDYESLPSGQLHPWTVAKKIENKQKNRYKNIIPYDHSLVKLEVLNNVPHSDYINASFIDGFKRKKEYIATQGPNSSSMDDFWRMVWQYDCRKIVMLTKCVEGEKQHGSTRTVVQFHYTSWPDMGVPQYATPLVKFIGMTKEQKTRGAGVGRTGTFITLDAMLGQAEEEGVVDVYNFVKNMREQRIKMVQVAEQYEFIFETLMETFTCGDTSITQDDFHHDIVYPSLSLRSPDTGASVLQEQFAHLDTLTVKPKDSDRRAAKDPANVSKNRYQDKIPTDKSRPYLSTEVENGTNYINASFLPGYTRKDAFIGTQSPLRHTVVDFWRLVYDYNITTIVMLNGRPSEHKSMAQYWPDGHQHEAAYGPFVVSLTDEDLGRNLSSRTFKLSNTSSQSRDRTVHQLELTTWPLAADVASSPESVVELHQRAIGLNGSRGKMVKKYYQLRIFHRHIASRDGEGATGTFVAASSVLDRLAAEKVIDVFQACKRLRAVRQGAVASLAQYEFIYAVVKSYLDSFEVYVNCRI